MATLTISLPDSLREFVQKQMDLKGFDNVSEYIRTLIRQAQEEEEESRMEVLLRDGLVSGKGVAVDAEFWKDLKREADRLLKKRSRK